MPAPVLHQWEMIQSTGGSIIYRMLVPGGWLYWLGGSSSPVFVPDTTPSMTVPEEAPPSHS
jgi:hypothetical protein